MYWTKQSTEYINYVFMKYNGNLYYVHFGYGLENV